MKEISADVIMYLFLLRMSLCMVTLFLVRQHRALLLRRHIFSTFDTVLFAVDAVCAAQPPAPERWGGVDAPGVPASIGVALCTITPLFVWIGRQEKRAPSALVVSLLMLFQRVTTVALWYKLFPLQLANAAVAAKCVWASLQNRDEPTLPRVV